MVLRSAYPRRLTSSTARIADTAATNSATAPGTRPRYRATGTRTAPPSHRRGRRRGGPEPPRCPIPRRNQVVSGIALSLLCSARPTCLPRAGNPGAGTSFQVEAPDAAQVVLAVELMGVERVRSGVGPFAGGEVEALVVVGGDLVALLPVGSEPAKVGQKHLRLAGDVGPHVPGGGLG